MGVKIVQHRLYIDVSGYLQTFWQQKSFNNLLENVIICLGKKIAQQITRSMRCYVHIPSKTNT